MNTIEIKIPKEVRQHKETIFFGLSVRQFICSAMAVSVAAGLFFLATFIPSLAITVRRIHDIGLSGWFYLLILIPYIGGLIILVFTLVPSQKNDNKWGPVPEGIRV